MGAMLRGADLVAGALVRAGLGPVYTLSGNHVMPVFDAALGTPLDLIHVRHEAACVHMADAHGRLSGGAGVALVTGGPGHGNAVGALLTAHAGESPLVLLSGHAGLSELGRGAFQETDQVAMAAPAVKAAWLARDTAALAHDVARAIRTACSGRPGPVHISLPFDVLERRIDETPALWPDVSAFAPLPLPLGAATAEAILATLAAARRPLILAGPASCTPAGRPRLAALANATGAPVLGLESPRGINDPSLGAFAQVLAEADLVVLLGKRLDFTLRFGDAPAVNPSARFVVVDPDPALLAGVVAAHAQRVALAAVADAPSAIAEVAARAAGNPPSRDAGWQRSVTAATTFRPAAWSQPMSKPHGPVHPVDLGRAVDAALSRDPRAVFVCDGGEVGQWAQACVTAPRRIINGPAGSIGAAIPFALAARRVEREAAVIAVMGDGTFGFHMAEVDTAVRCGLPVVLVVGNDAAWNAEHQIQIRDYGAARAHACELDPARYDLVASALGGHGELVTEAGAVAPALDRAMASGKPAVVNVMIERLPAPVVRR